PTTCCAALALCSARPIDPPIKPKPTIATRLNINKSPPHVISNQIPRPISRRPLRSSLHSFTDLISRASRTSKINQLIQPLGTARSYGGPQHLSDIFTQQHIVILAIESKEAR